MMERVAAVIVSFNNAAMLRALLAAVTGQTRPPDQVIVVDNASTDDTRRMVTDEFPSVKARWLEQNTGSAGGYREGFAMAAGSCDFIWTLDDDVEPRPDALAHLLTGIADLGAHHQIAAVRSVNEHHRFDHPTSLAIAPWRGTLFSTAAVAKAGLPDKDYFIYGEDLEYSLRLRRLGYTFFWVPSSVCPEMRPGKVEGRLLGHSVVLYPSAFRLYYAFRNEVSIFLKYRLPQRLLRTLLYAAKVIAYLLVTEKTRGTMKVAAISAGIADGLRGRLGKNSRYTP
jgi:rhamnopyranosyl-N-acetylglucosaminyl-diphospho-decaprenol beta-1,3/1,4-galactofuranosyltransferase